VPMMLVTQNARLCHRARRTRHRRPALRRAHIERPSGPAACHCGFDLLATVRRTIATRTSERELGRSCSAVVSSTSARARDRATAP